jgi:hypothetical protein
MSDPLSPNGGDEIKFSFEGLAGLRRAPFYLKGP